MKIEYSPTYSILRGCSEQFVSELSQKMEHCIEEEQLRTFVNAIGKGFPFTKSYTFKATLNNDDGTYDIKFYSGFIKTVLMFFTGLREKPEVISSVSKYICNDTSVSDILYAHQKKIVTKCLKNKWGVVKSPTSSGKSYTIAELVRKLANDGLKVLVTVPTISLLDQLTKDIHDFRKLHGCESIEIGQVGNGKYDFKDVTVGIPNSLSNLDKTEEYLNTVDALISDECLTRDNLVLTSEGYISIADKSIIGKHAISFHPIYGYQLKEIYAHFIQGYKSILKISCHNCELRCTDNHKIKTLEGWKLANQITTEDYIQSLVPNVAIQNWVQQEKLITSKCLDVENVSPDLSTLDLQVNGLIKNFHQKLKDLSMEQYWEIVVYTTLIQMQNLLDCDLLTEKYRENGQIIKHQDLLIWILNVKQLLIKALGIFLESEVAILIQNWLKYINVLQTIIKNKLVDIGLIKYLMRELLGGIWMMGHYLIQEYHPGLDFQQKDTVYQKLKLFQYGLEIKDLIIQLNNQNKNIGLLNLALKYLETGLVTLEDTVPIVCDINFERVINIIQDGTEEVYDISVKDNHNFIANNLLVHNCHTTCNATYAVMISAMNNRQVSIGLSATPENSPFLEAFFSKRIVEIQETEMIEKGIILDPLFEFYPAPKAYVPKVIAIPAGNIQNLPNAYRYKVLAAAYNHIIINNSGRNKLIVKKAVQRINKEIGPVLVIVNKVKGEHSHADILVDLFKEQGYRMPVISGYIAKKRKEKLIDDLKKSKIVGAIAGPKVLSAGISIPSLSTIILAGAGRSDTEFIQRVGRILRKKEGKERPLVIDFQDQQFWFASQSRSRMATAEQIYGTDNIILR